MTSDMGRPLAVTSDTDKLVVAYDSNKRLVLDTINRKLHQWSIDNMNKIPENYLRRYNRVLGIV